MSVNIIEGSIAPEIEAIDWLNTTSALSLHSLRGRVVAIYVFQMLCPGCVSHSLPQAKAVHNLYSGDNRIQVIGLHSVFEHHNVMNTDALKAFVHEYQLQFPIAVDAPSESDTLPITMQKLSLQGTPSLILVDKWGRIRLNNFGRINDLRVGSLIGGLIHEKSEGDYHNKDDIDDLAKITQIPTGNCDDHICRT